MTCIRQAEEKDISRIAEILVFSKRTHYRSIFHDDGFSFGVLQVLPAAQSFLDDPQKLGNYWVCDDGFVKGLIHLEGDEIAELYVDPFFERQRIGSGLIEFALSKIAKPKLWVLEGNDGAIRFYQKQGFSFTGERKFVPGTDKYEQLMQYCGPVKGQDPVGKIVHVTVDRPLGSTHPEYPDIVYPVNYGYVKNITGGDGEPQDAYVLGIDHAVSEITGLVIAVIHRENDNEDKWVVAPPGKKFFISDIRRQTDFVEKYFRSKIYI